MSNDINIRFRVWVDKNDSPYLGLGRIVLLENIIKYGSITQAAKAIKMSYRKAWQLIDDMNSVSEKPLVVKKMGGKEGGGTIVTQEGRQTIKKFYNLQDKVDSFLQDFMKENNF